MCGIAGSFGTRPADRAVRRMVAHLGHRGPDDAGVLPLTRADGSPAGCFGHTRLAILDPSDAGHQPMRTTDGRLALVLNGEIYNYRELRDELARDGASFGSSGDTEVLLRGWERHGPSFVTRLRGMYAFAVWDAAAGTGWLARDPFGIKPLYLIEGVDGVHFASEVRALLAAEVAPRRLSPDGIAAYLAGSAPAEPATIVEGVRCLEPGAVVEVGPSGRGPSLRTVLRRDVWHQASRPGPDEPADPRRRVRAALRDSVAAHLVSDVPLGIFLSGGIDSASLVAVASELADQPVRTFSVTFREPEFDESAAARAVARRFRTDHTEIPVSAERMPHVLADAFAAMDQPTIDGVNTFVVSRAVRSEGTKVALSGIGGDELFCGYPSFRRARQRAWLDRAPGPARAAAERLAARRSGLSGEKLRALLERTEPARASCRSARMLFPDEAVTRLCGRSPSPHRRAAPDDLSLLGRVTWYETEGYLRNVLLRDADVFSMANGLELRVPFLDPAVLRAALAADDAAKLRRGVSKPLLVGALGDLLPRAVWARPKRGFVFPFQSWLRTTLRREVEQALVAPRLARVGVDPGEAADVWRSFRDGGEPSMWTRAWALYVLVRWAEENDVSVGEGAARAAVAGGSAFR